MQSYYCLVPEQYPASHGKSKVESQFCIHIELLQLKHVIISSIIPHAHKMCQSEQTVFLTNTSIFTFVHFSILSIHVLCLVFIFQKRYCMGLNTSLRVPKILFHRTKYTSAELMLIQQHTSSGKYYLPTYQKHLKGYEVFLSLICCSFDNYQSMGCRI